MKKEFKKPIIAVLNAETANIICGSGPDSPTIPGGEGTQPTGPQARRGGIGGGITQDDLDVMDF